MTSQARQSNLYPYAIAEAPIEHKADPSHHAPHDCSHHLGLFSSIAFGHNGPQGKAKCLEQVSDVAVNASSTQWCAGWRTVTLIRTSLPSSAVRLMLVAVY